MPCTPAATRCPLPVVCRPPSEDTVWGVGCGDRLDAPWWSHPVDRPASRRALNSRILDERVANGRMSRAENLHPGLLLPQRALTGSSLSGSKQESKPVLDGVVCPQPAACMPVSCTCPVLLPPQCGVAVAVCHFGLQRGIEAQRGKPPFNYSRARTCKIILFFCDALIDGGVWSSERQQEPAPAACGWPINSARQRGGGAEGLIQGSQERPAGQQAPSFPGRKTPTQSPTCRRMHTHTRPLAHSPTRTHSTPSTVSATERSLKWPLQRRMTW